jgi:hypothetical protein
MDTVTRTEPSSQVATAVPLTALDRCDTCGAQAYVRAVLPNGQDLLFCGHHANTHRPGLVMAGALFQDETSRLSVKRESGFNG